VIGIQLKGRLGNQMFQYAAARTLAERLGHALVLAGHTVGRPFGVAGHWLGVDKRPPYTGMQQNGILHAAFGRGPSFVYGRALELGLLSFQHVLFHQTFSPRRLTTAEGHSYEVFDQSLFELRSHTWLSGWFQSEGYFAANSARVREWFQPRAEDALRLQEIVAGWPAAPEGMVAVHVRRRDYGQIRDSLSHNDQGWMLPMSYYRIALDRVPRGAALAVFSDDPNWAEREFADRRPWVSRDNSAVVDMFLMARCRWNVTANSSFSWWAAWLNTWRDKVVFAPMYHLGWRFGCWVPGGIEVAGWEYLHVTS
jgi:Glycosyl transferase family 11